MRNAKLLRLDAFFLSILGKRNGSGKGRTKRVTGTQAQSKLTAGKQADFHCIGIIAEPLCLYLAGYNAKSVLGRGIGNA